MSVTSATSTGPALQVSSSQQASNSPGVVPTFTWKQVPDDCWANVNSNKAAALIKEGQPAKAIELIESTLQELNEKPEPRAIVSALYNRLGLAHSRVEQLQVKEGKKLAPDYTLAFENTRKALENDPKYPPGLYNLSCLHLKKAIVDSGQWTAFANKENIDSSLLSPDLLNSSFRLLATAVSIDAEYFHDLAKEKDNDWLPVRAHPDFMFAVQGRPLSVGQQQDSFASGNSDGAARRRVVLNPSEEI